MHRQPNQFLGASDPRVSGLPPHRRFHQGSVIPMNGGVLTIGAYYLNITVGTGAGQQTFNVIVDTGSSNTAVPSVPCPACQAPAVYNRSSSPTARPLPCDDPMCLNCLPTAVGSTAVPEGGTNATCVFGEPICRGETDHCGFAVSYGGSSSGTAGAITRDLACFTGTNLCADIYLDEQQEEFPVGTQPTGILGLAFPANSCCPTCQPTFLDSLVAQGNLAPSENLFGMCLNPASGGQIDIGQLDDSKYNPSEMQYTPVVLERWYNINVKDMKVAGVSIGCPAYLYGVVNDGIGAFPDSGTGTVLIAPLAFSYLQTVMIAKYQNLTGVKQLLAGQCVNLTQQQVRSYPPMSFTIAGASPHNADFDLHMTSADYLMPTGVGNLFCFGIAGVPSIGVILGDIIMANYYIAFDRANSRVGFAPILSC
jgi:hypothetical protein